MAARALLLSLLSRQRLLLKAQGFRQRYPHGWLVWEAGTWNVPHAGEEIGTTRLPLNEIADCLPQSDVLCFEIAPPRSGTLKLGRSPENDIVINDATVSREHLELGFEGERPWAKPLLEASETAVNGVPMDRIHLTPLVNGARMLVGGVALTYHSADGFEARLEAHAERLAGEAGDTAATP
ncbi:MAG: FHA domain-containing protein [Myxococcaceae bacterium]|nr:FHA domain-containing protein [Myxococcaceae bacterium]